jgi:zinc transport system ATP-binding protein
MKNINLPKENEKPSCCGLCCTKVENFGVKIGQTTILYDVNLHIHCGEITAIIGPNGAGKSTLIKAIIGEVPHTGSIHFEQTGTKYSKAPVIGYVPQNLMLDKTSPTSVLDLFLSCQSNRPVWFIHSGKEIKKVIERLSRVKAEHLINRRLGALSGGELQRVLLALSLDPVPDILLLDEPVSGIDRNGLELFYEIVSSLRKEYDMTIILVSHDLDMIEKYADRAVLLNHTVLASGPPGEILNSEIFSQVFSFGNKNRVKGRNGKN